MSMTTNTTDAQRRLLLQEATGVAAIALPGLREASAGMPSPRATGKAGDFDFLAGEWKIRHRRLTGPTWIEFDGEATVFTILGGIGSVEELRIPSQDFSGMGLRLLDLKQALWADYWCNAKSGVLQTATLGCFVAGVGMWNAEDTENGKRIIVRGVWDQVTPVSCRWYQAVSRDDGRTWEENWIMQWQRVKAT